MNKYLYYGGTLAIYEIAVIGGVFINDLGLVFTIAAALSGSVLCFIMPGFFYIYSEKRFVAEENRHERKVHIIMSWIYIVIGFIALLVLLGTGIYSAVQ